MKQRCTNPKCTSYPRYGGLGVAYSQRWESFSGFLADMGVRPDGTSLDRWPDKAGDYEPGNCRWATALQQANNRRNSALLTYMGRTQTIAEWAAEIGLNKNTLTSRVRRLGWPIDAALTKQAHAS